MNPQEPYVSVIEPISPAIERVKMVLFRPFDLGRWFIIGFCAWLASLGNPPNGGGPRVQYRMGEPSSLEEARHKFDEARYFVEANPWVVGAAVAGAVVVVALVLLLIWLSSRGRFMFLHCVVQNRAEVTNPWHRFRRHANSLFAFRAVVALLGILAVSAFAVVAVVTVLVLQVTLGATILSIVGVVAYFLSLIAVLIVFGIVASFTQDFVVPIMYLHGLSCRQGWATLLDLIAVNKLRFLLYLLFQFLIGIAISVIVFGLACVTCGCACCFFALPYIGTVVLLPVIMFRRAYSLYYLAQYGPDLNAFLPEPAPAPAAPEVPM